MTSLSKTLFLLFIFVICFAIVNSIDCIGWVNYIIKIQLYQFFIQENFLINLFGRFGHYVSLGTYKKPGSTSALRLINNLLSKSDILCLVFLSTEIIKFLY